MEVSELDIAGVFLLKPKVFKDGRGYFFESFNQKKFEKATGLSVDFVQDNESLSSTGVARGIHFQYPPYEQAKLVRVVTGKVLDYIIDLRQGSSTYKKFITIELSASEHNQVFLPRGMGHGFITLEDNTIFSYKVDNFYSPDHDAGVHFFSENLHLPLPLAKDNLSFSKKDQSLPDLKEVESTLLF